MSQSVVGRGTWWWVVLLGLTGQLAWTIENMYLNVFVYDTITDNPTVLAVLVASSAVAATVATLLAGAWSDRVGRRRPFIALGYILWGGATASFGLIDVETAARFLPAFDAVVVAIVAIILLDCIMSALGSTANDAAFNAWVTDTTTPANRGRVDGVLATFPLLAMLIVFGALDPLTQAGRWLTFFSVVGGVTAVVGVVAWFRLREAPKPRPSGSYLASVVHGLRPSTARANPRLYLALLAWAVLGTSTQVFLPFLIIYVQRYLRIENYPLVLATVLIGAAAVRYFEQMGFYDALWWAFVTATTVGYGDISPSTAGGRIVAIMLMLVGIGFISTLTGTIASFFVAPAPEPEAKPGNEFLALALRRLEDFQNLSPEEVREICAVLQGLKEKQ